MSTILEALRELEGTPAPGTQDAPVPWTDGARRQRVIAAIAVVVLVGGALGLVLALRARTPAAAPSPVLAPPVAAPSPAKAATAPVERPWGYVQSKPAVAPEPAPVEHPPARVALARPAEHAAPPVTARPAEHAAPVAAPPAGTRADTAPAAAAPPATVTTPHDAEVTRIIGVPVAPARAAANPAPRPLGAPHVRVTGLAYAESRGERIAALTVDGGTPVTLHEGEAADGIEVQLILPDRVYVRHGSNVFAVDALP